MTDHSPQPSSDETPAQKALRLKKAASGGSRPGAGKPDPRAAQAASLSKSKPALRK